MIGFHPPVFFSVLFIRRTKASQTLIVQCVYFPNLSKRIERAKVMKLHLGTNVGRLKNLRIYTLATVSHTEIEPNIFLPTPSTYAFAMFFGWKSSSYGMVTKQNFQSAAQKPTVYRTWKI